MSIKNGLLVLFLQLCIVATCFGQDPVNTNNNVNTVQPTSAISKDIKVISSIPDISVTYGDLITLPSSLQVVYDDYSVGSVTVSWATYSKNAGAVRTVNGTITLPSGVTNSDNLQPSVKITIGKKTVTGVLQGYVTKIYDANVTARPIANNYRLEGIVGNDDVHLVYPSTGTYADKNRDDNIIVTVTGLSLSGGAKDNYQLASTSTSATVGFINAASLTLTAAGDTKTYDGVAYAPNKGATFSGFVGGETQATSDLTGSLSYTGNAVGAKSWGSYEIYPTGFSSNNYAIYNQYGRLTINRRALTLTANNRNKTYGTAFNLGSSEFTPTNLVAGESVAVTLTSNGTPFDATATNFVIEISDARGSTIDNYTITYRNGTLAVAKKQLTITAKNDSKSYDGKTYSGGNDVNYSGFISGENESDLGGTLSYTGTSQSAKNGGTYIITPRGYSSTNYDFLYVNGTLTINAIPLKVTAKDFSREYNNTAFSGGNGVDYDGFLSGEGAGVLTGPLTYGGNSQGAKARGTYNVTPGGLSSPNYTITFANGTLTITKAKLTVTAKDASKTYDRIAFTGGNGVTYSGFAAGDNESNAITGSVTYGGTSQNAKEGGEYTIIPGGLNATNNYDITYVNGKLTINKVTLTIKAKAQEKNYDGVAYVGGNGVDYTGFLAGDDASVLGGTLTYGGNSQNKKDAGVYTITPGGYTSSTYIITYTDATLTIKKIPLVLTAKDLVKAYDAIPYSGGNGVTGDNFAAGESAASLGGQPVFGGTSQGAKNVNSYVITVTGYTSPNYDITYKPGALTIQKANLLVTAKDFTKTYDGVAYINGNGVDFAGLATGESATNLGGTLVYGGTAQTAVKANVYTIIPSGYTSDNYAIAYANGKLTINKKELTVTAENKKKYTGTANPALTITYSGFAGTETDAALPTKPTPTTTATTTSPTNSYAIVPAGGVSDNYSFKYVNGTLLVEAGLTTSLTGTITNLLENRPAGTVTGSFASVSENPTATFTYSLVSGTGDTDNALFVIAGNEVRSLASMDYETQKHSFSVRVRSTTQYGSTLDKEFVIALLDVNEIPTVTMPVDTAFCSTPVAQKANLTGITAGPETAQTTTLTVSSDNAALFSSLQVVSTGGQNAELRYAIKENASGAATVTVVVQDNGGVANSGVDKVTKTFHITIHPLPDFNITSEKGTTLSMGNTTRLFLNGASGTVVWTPETALNTTAGYSPTARPLQTTTYKATVTTNKGCVGSQQITITVNDDFQALGARKLVTPNGDGVNDFFVIENLDVYPNNQLQVFDRSGKVVYERRNYDNTWNGTLNSRILMNGTYFYVLTVNNQVIQKGTLTIAK